MFLDIFFEKCPREYLTCKPAFAVVTGRRSGLTTAHTEINDYFAVSNMIITASTYWTIIHGMSADEMQKDGEAMQALDSMAVNYAYYLKLRECAIASGIDAPVYDKKVFTDYIRQDTYSVQEG